MISIPFPGSVFSQCLCYSVKSESNSVNEPGPNWNSHPYEARFPESSVLIQWYIGFVIEPGRRKSFEPPGLREPVVQRAVYVLAELYPSPSLLSRRPIGQSFFPRGRDHPRAPPQLLLAPHDRLTIHAAPLLYPASLRRHRRFDFGDVAIFTDLLTSSYQPSNRVASVLATSTQR